MKPKHGKKPVAPSEHTQELETRCAEYLAGWKRAQADYQNLSKRLSDERSEAMRLGAADALSRLLPAIDGFESAYGSVPEHLKDDAWVKGIGYVRQLFQTSLKDAGLEEIPATTTFDPVLHEAVDEAEDASHAPGEIIRTVRQGYRLHGHVLRPAAVVVAAGPKSPETPPPAADETSE